VCRTTVHEEVTDPERVEELESTVGYRCISDKAEEIVGSAEEQLIFEKLGEAAPDLAALPTRYSLDLE
jgi:hypothetical protein